MNKIVEAVKEGRKIETKVLFSVVNDFCLTRLAVKTSDGDSVVSMQVNKCEDRKDEYRCRYTVYYLQIEKQFNSIFHDY